MLYEMSESEQNFSIERIEVLLEFFIKVDSAFMHILSFDVGRSKLESRGRNHMRLWLIISGTK